MPISGVSGFSLHELHVDNVKDVDINTILHDIYMVHLLVERPPERQIFLT
jgi:hypothetical protein